MLPLDRVPARTKDLLPHLAVLAFVFLIVQLPRLGGAGGAVFGKDRGFLDFDLGYYPAAVAIRTDPSALYSGARFDETKGAVQINTAANFVNIPVVAWLFVPFTLLPLKQAGMALLALNIFLSLWSLALLLRNVLNRKAQWAITLAFVTSGPLLNALNLGQTSPLILLLLVIMQLCFLRNQHVIAGLLLGIIGLIKIPPLLLLLYFVLRRNWRVAGSAAAVVVGAFAVSVLVYGWDLHREYVDLVFRANLGKAIAAHNCQSISSFLARALPQTSLLSWQPVELPFFWHFLQLVMQLLVVALAGFFAVRSGENIPPMHAFLAAGLLVLPITWSHYGAWMLPVFASIVVARSSWRMPIVAMVLINLPVLPVAVVRHFEHAIWFRLAVSHMFLGVLLLFTIVRRQPENPVESKFRRAVGRASRPSRRF